MLMQARLPVSTASKQGSVWRDLDQDTFRKHIVDLQRAAKEVPADPVVHSANEWLRSHSEKASQSRLLPFETEQRIADDLAFVAAAQEGHKEISAVGLEERTEVCGLVVRITANELISQHVKDALKAIFDVLNQCASRKLSRVACAQSLFDRVITVNENRIYGRLESVHWHIPKHLGTKNRNPLYKGVQRLSSDLEQTPSNNHAGSALLVEKSVQLCSALQKVDEYGRDTDEGRNALAHAIKNTYDFCTSGGANTLEQTTSNYGVHPIQASSHKIIRKLDKLGRYWGLCESLAQDSRKYADLFTNIRLEPLPPYEGMSSKIALLPGIRARCLVHAEMQLLAFYSKIANVHIRKPRIIGVSKSCCYLCNLFIIRHGQYFITKTHGRLYERWNFPDLNDFEATEREKFRSILRAIDEELQLRFRIETRKPGKREQPMGSWLTLPPALELSPVPSTILSSVPAERKGHSTLAVRTTPPFSLPNRSTASPPVSDIVGSKIKPEALPAAPTATVSSNLGTTLSTHDGDDQSSQSGNAAPWEYQIQRTIASEYPVRYSYGGASVTIEIDNPAQGIVAMARIKDEEQSNTSVTVDLQKMDAGEVRHFDRKDGEDNVLLSLRHPDDKLTHVALQWL